MAPNPGAMKRMPLDLPRLRAIHRKGSRAFSSKTRANLQSVTRLDRIPRQRVDKFAERRAELAEAALRTLSELGYARTSLREIAQNSEFTHGVLHYYFRDKVDLILCSVRQYKAQCVTRYDQVTADARTYNELMTGFLAALAQTMRDEAHMHRLWYDIRSQTLFETAFRADVAELDKSLETMIWRIMCRFAELSGEPQTMPPSVIYAMIDGLFQHGLLKHLSGDEQAIGQMQSAVRLVLSKITKDPAATA
jgi:AcrR family transcriptional regulator